MLSKTFKKIKIELADTPQKRSTGLMFRKSIDKDYGMLFVFNSKDKLSFWGANTYIPLDIAFIDGNKIIDIKEIVPLSTKPVKSSIPCDRALEISSDFFNKNNISIGSLIEINNDELIFVTE